LLANPAIGMLSSMSTVEEIESAIQQLSADEMAAFPAWYAEFDAAAWDRKIAEDEAAGRPHDRHDRREAGPQSARDRAANGHGEQLSKAVMTG
jgi:hypothetical protein